MRKMMSPNTATNLRVSHEVFLCAVWCAVSAFKTCTHLCVCVAECCCAIIDFCQSRVMTTVFDWRVCHCIKLCFPSMAICHFPPCFNADCCKICTATEQLFFTSEVHWLCLLGYIVSSNLTIGLHRQQQPDWTVTKHYVCLADLFGPLQHKLLGDAAAFASFYTLSLFQVVSPGIYQHHSQKALTCCYDSLCCLPLLQT